MTAVVEGEVQGSGASAPSVLPHVSSGRRRALASTGPRRSPELPDVPTMTADCAKPRITCNISDLRRL